MEKVQCEKCIKRFSRIKASKRGEERTFQVGGQETLKWNTKIRPASQLPKTHLGK